MKRFYFLIAFSLILTCNFSLKAQSSGIFDAYIVTETNSGGNFYNHLVDTGGFNGAFLGSFSCTETLVIRGGQAKTYKNGGHNVFNSSLFYRIYPTGSPSGGFSEINLNFHLNLANPGDQQWDNVQTGFPLDIQLLDGLAPGNYTIEVYVRSQVDTNNDNQIDLDNYWSNFGNNFKATFEVLNSPPNITCPTNITANSINGECGANVDFTVEAQSLCNPSIIFSEEFIQGQNSPHCEAWNDFRASLLGNLPYTKATIRGSLNPTGVSISDPVKVLQLANSLRTGNQISVNDGSLWWTVGTCGNSIYGNAIEFTVSNGPSSTCSCYGYYTVRPCIQVGINDNPNWGGISTGTTSSWTTCVAQSQTLTVEFELASSNSNPVTTSVVSNPPSGSFFPVGTTTVTSVATDSNGNVSSCTFDVTVEDLSAPEALCQNISVELDSNGIATITPEAVDNGSFDDCGAVTLSLDTDSFDCNNLGDNIVTLTVTDENGNTATCDATVTVVDNTPPTLVCQDITVNLDANGTFVITSANFVFDNIITSYSDNCTVTNVVSFAGGTNFNCENVGVTNSRSVRLTDTSGNQSDWCTFNITVLDPLSACNEPPIAVCQNITIDADANCSATVLAAAFDGGSTDPDNDVLTFAVDNPGPYPLGTTNVILTVSDGEFTDVCTATITVEDNTAPSAVCNDITIELDASGNYTLTQADIEAIGNGSTDACGDVSFSVNNTTFDCSDVSGGSATASELFFSEYGEAASGSNKYLEIFNGTGSPVDMSGYELQRVSNGGSFPEATVGLSGTLQDGEVLIARNSSATAPVTTAGNINISSGNISHNGDDAWALVRLSDNTIIDLVGEEGPDPGTGWDVAGVNNATADHVLTRKASVTSGNTNWDASRGTNASDSEWNVLADSDYSSLGTHSLAAGPSGVQVTLTVTDENSNVATCTATVTVEDNTAPNAICQNVTVQLDSSGNGSITAEQVDNGSNDNCAVASMELSQTAFDCSHVGQTNTVTLLVTDTSGNTASCTANVTVLDEVAPTVVCNDITVELDASGNYTLTQADIEAIGNGSSDACGEVSYSVDINTFDCSNVVAAATPSNDLFISEYMEGSSNNKCLEIFNGTGNTVDLSNYSLRFYFNGGTSPGNTIALSGSLNNGDVYVVCDNDATIISGDLDNNGSFYNGDDAIELLNNNNTIDVIGQIGFDPGSEWGTGDVSTQNNTIRRKPSVTDGDSNGSDAFDPSSEWDGFDIDTIDGFGSHSVGGGSSPVVTLTVTDENGNSATCTATVTVEDNVAPTVSCNPFEAELDENGHYTLTENDIAEIAAGSSDACGIASLSVSPDTFSCADADQVIDVTLTVTDNNGNTNTCSTVILVVDSTPPTVVCNDITVELDASGNYTLTQADIEAIGNGSADACGIASLSVDNADFDCSDVVVSEPVVASDIFFSEYVEGSSFNKYIEIFNGTGSNVDLSDYELRLYSNGNSSPSTSNPLSGILADGDVIVYANNGAVVYGGATTVASAVNWNGDDAIELYKISSGTSVDIFGKIGEDPGSQWVVAGNTTQNQTLRRNANVTQGNVDDLSGFPSLGTEWTGLPQDDVSGLGTHTMSSGNLDSPTVVLTVTDVNGNSSSCEATVTVLDNIAPTVVCNAITVELDDTGNYTLSSVDIDAIANGTNDACGIASLTVSPDSFTCAEIGFNTVTLTVIDNNGNENTCTTSVNVVDVTTPVVICQDLTVQLDANGAASITPADIDGGSYDVCSDVILEISQNTFDCDDVNAVVPINDLFISEYIEGSGNNKCIEIFNGTGSSVNLSSYTLVRYSNGSTNGTNISLSGTIADGDVHVICNSSADGAFLALADQTTGSVSHNGDDAYELVNNGNVIDIFGSVGEDPGSEWNVSGNETQDRTLRRNINVTKGNLNNTVGFPSLGTEWTEFSQNNLENLGSHEVDARGVEVTLTVTDTYGNFDSCVAIVRVEDNIAPEITCVPNTTLDTDPGVCDYTVVGSELDATFTDNCSSGSITNDYNNDASLAGAIFPQGTTLVTWTVDDGNGQVVTCTTEVTVEDNEAPVVNCLSLQVQLDEFGNGSISEEDINGDSTDNCEIASISLSQLDFDCSDIGGDLDGLIISEYVDGAGDNDCIEIFNGTGNTVNLYGDNYVLRVYADGGTTALYEVPLLGTIADRDVYVLCFGNNDGASQADQIDGFAFDGNDAVALVKDGNAVDVVGVIGNNPGTGWSSGGVSTAGTTLVRNNDVLQGNINAFVANMATEWTQYPQGTYSNLGAHDIEITDLANNVILTVTDTSGNVSTCEGNVTVVDLVPPVPACQDITVQLGIDGTATVAPSQVDNGSDDACGIATLELNVTEFDCSNIGANPVVLTVTDVNGNTATCSATVTIEDNVAPTVVTQNITVQLDDQGNASIEALDVDGGSTDACGIESYAVTPNSFDCSNIGENTVTLTVTDIHGNAASETAVVTVEDMVNPIAVCNDISIYLNADGTYTLSQSDIDAIADGSTDNCDTDLTYSVSPDTFTCAEEGDNTVTLTVTDDYGNSSTCTATVTVDGSFPEVTISQSELPEFCQGAVVVLTANSDEAVEYLWNSGEETASIEVGANGIYGVLVTSATNCTAYAEFEVTGFDAGALVAAYTILAEEDVYLHGNNLVQTGAVGAMDPNIGNIRLHQATTVVDFGQAVSFDLNQGSTIGSQVFAPANPTIPAFVYNTLSNAGSPDATVNNNQTQTLNGSVYDVVTVKQNATVIFTQSNVYINELNTFDGASIEFENCANVFINEKFMLAQNGTINADDPNKVVFYVNQDVQIEKGSYVRASIHAYFHELLVKGDQNGAPTYMTGLFIANRVHGNKNTVWNADDLCDPCPVDQPVSGGDVTDSSDLRLGIDMEVTAWPNPSKGNFNLKLKTAVSTENVDIEVYDMNNRLVHKGDFSYDGTHVFGDKLDGGVYIVKVTQSGITKSVRLVRY